MATGNDAASSYSSSPVPRKIVLKSWPENERIEVEEKVAKESPLLKSTLEEYETAGIHKREIQLLRVSARVLPMVVEYMTKLAELHETRFVESPSKVEDDIDIDDDDDKKEKEAVEEGRQLPYWRAVMNLEDEFIVKVAEDATVLSELAVASSYLRLIDLLDLCRSALIALVPFITDQNVEKEVQQTIINILNGSI